MTVCRHLVAMAASVLVLAAGLMAEPSFAGDRRAVTEPALPSRVCATLSPSVPSGSASQAGDTDRLQSAIDSCPGGQAVHLIGGVFSSGPLTMKSGVTLWIDRGAVLMAVSNPVAYDRGNGSCGTIDDKGTGCRPFILFSKTKGGGIVGDGIIDGQGGQVMTGRDETWWQLARRAQTESGKQNNPRLIEVDGAHDITFYRMTLRNAPNFHVALNDVQGATFWGLRIDTPADARNTDGIDPGASQDITITKSSIRTGDDNIAIKAGKGPTRHISLVDDHFYWGHGLSIGSETSAGVSDILVRDVTLDGTTSGLRIKSDTSRGGLVDNVRYENVCLRRNKRPIDFATRYDEKAAGNDIPVYRDILLRNVVGTTGTLVIQGYDAAHPLGVTLDGVRFDAKVNWQIENAVLATGRGGVWPPRPGLASSSAGVSVKGCERRWAPFPSLASLQPNAR